MTYLHKFKYNSQKKFLISPCSVIVLLLNKINFGGTVFEFVSIITALVLRMKLIF